MEAMARAVTSLKSVSWSEHGSVHWSTLDLGLAFERTSLYFFWQLSDSAFTVE